MKSKESFPNNQIQQERVVKEGIKLKRVNNLLNLFLSAGLAFLASGCVGLDAGGRFSEVKPSSSVEISINKKEKPKGKPSEDDEKKKDISREEIVSIFREKHKEEFQVLDAMKNKEEKLKEVFGVLAPRKVGSYLVYLEGEAIDQYHDFDFWQISPKMTTEVFNIERETYEDQEPVLELTGLETIDGEISSEKLRDLIQTLPRHWVDGEVSSIKQISDEGGVESRDGSKWTTVAEFKKESDKDSHTGQIVFYSQSKSYSFGEMAGTVYHEIAHANDWGDDDDARYNDKLDLLMKISDRISAPDRYLSKYVESIKNDTPEKTRYRKALEYWAEICSVYFSNPANLSLSDIEIVDWWVHKNDQDFDLVAQFARRSELLADLGDRASIRLAQK